jgi:acetyl-CoA carboxylase biotin carboxyl carrier protein
MGFSIDDVMQVIQIVKECKDTELHIDTGDIKLSLFKGEVADGARSPLIFSGPACICEEPVAPAVSTPAPVQAAPVPVEAAPTPEVEKAPEAGLPPEALDEDISEEGLHEVKASVPSVFYRRPNPEEPPFVEIGDEVEPDTVLCLLEVMKCYRQVMAGVKGRIVKICVESNTLVDESTTLFLIQPE